MAEYDFTWVAEAQFTTRLELTDEQLQRLVKRGFVTRDGDWNIHANPDPRDKSFIDFLMKVAEYDIAFSPDIEDLTVQQV